ncbi:MAG: hypothetical protein QOF78_2884, partial [Phycisphaerales bacterium]|nr:hypothetical protein [Phycisphaerales bacterium]
MRATTGLATAVVVLAVSIAGGCAKSQINLGLDLYQQDIKISKPLTSAELKKYQTDLARLATD